MLKTIVAIGLSGVIGFLATTSLVAKADGIPTPAERMERLGKIAKYGKTLKKGLGKKTRALSSGGQVIVDIGSRWKEIKPLAQKAIEGGGTLQENEELAGMLDNILAPVPGSNQVSTDDNYSNFAGITQSETSAAWWGANSIVGFNDSGSFMRTLIAPDVSGNFSFTGWCSSANANVALPTQPGWTDRGALIAPTPVGGGWRDNFGDPVCKAARVMDFYFCTIGLDTRRMGDFSSILVFRSTNGGVSFPFCQAAAAVQTTLLDPRMLDKPDMDVKPGGSAATDIVHVAYTEFAPFGIVDAAIKYTRSINGGTSWSTPVTIATPTADFVQFVRVVQQQGTNNVYITWEDFGLTRTLRMRKSLDNGATWGATAIIGTVAPTGDGFALDWLQGIIRAGMEFSGLAVNPTNGHVYICYQQGEFTQPDVFGLGGLYRYTGIYFRRSTDGGVTWSAPIRVNNDAIATPFDQFQPGMAVSGNGKICIVYYDRRGSGVNFNMQVYVAVSTDGGATWANTSHTALFSPTPGAQDYLVNPVYMGDYNYPAGDSSKVDNTNFIIPFTSCAAGNQDVFVEKTPN